MFVDFCSPRVVFFPYLFCLSKYFRKGLSLGTGCKVSDLTRRCRVLRSARLAGERVLARKTRCRSLSHGLLSLTTVTAVRQTIVRSKLTKADAISDSVPLYDAFQMADLICR